MTRAARRVPMASKRGLESVPTYKLARWLHKPCSLGAPQHCGAGDSFISDHWVGR